MFIYITFEPFSDSPGAIRSSYRKTGTHGQKNGNEQEMDRETLPACRQSAQFVTRRQFRLKICPRVANTL